MQQFTTYTMRPQHHTKGITAVHPFSLRLAVQTQTGTFDTSRCTMRAASGAG